MPHPCPAEEAGFSPHTRQASLGLTVIHEESCKSVRTVHPDSCFTATLSTGLGGLHQPGTCLMCTWTPGLGSSLLTPRVSRRHRRGLGACSPGECRTCSVPTRVQTASPEHCDAMTVGAMVLLFPE